jgi:malate dehydrogenase (oxaloacetate-decarboxylating)(NADP+)
MYFTENDRGHMASMLYNWPHKDVHVIVVTDGSRILGLGDLGANGMGIPIGKLSLYCAAGGIAPHRVLPVVLDVGTNNPELLEDKFYLGVQQPRLNGKDYFELVEEFMLSVRYRWPNVLVQFEDFSSDHAQILLNHYRDDHLCFNDDIQGTGATTLAGLLGALRAKGEAVEALGDQTIVIAGAGSAGIGVAQVLKQAMMEQGKSEEEARKAFFVVDQHGLLGKERLSSLSGEQAQFVRDEDDGLPLLEVIKKYKPSMLLGMTAVGGLFKEDMIRAMAANCDRPIIFPLSNPTTKAECTAEQAFEWTDGNCIFASGSPFDPVTMSSGRTVYPTQCNNMYVSYCFPLSSFRTLLSIYIDSHELSDFSFPLHRFIFPGIGLGVTVAGCKTVTDRMLYVAAKALANFVTPEELEMGKVFPHISHIRAVSHRVAVAVAEEAIREGQAKKLGVDARTHLAEYIANKMYYPEYVPLVEKREITI